VTIAAPVYKEKKQQGRPRDGKDREFAYPAPL